MLNRGCARCGVVSPDTFRFCGGCGAERRRARAAVARPAAERRRLSVLFCDLQGSVQLSQRLDPEDYARLIGRYRAACCAVLDRFDASERRFIGDGIRAYLGFPDAREDDAERAARAGLALAAAVRALNVDADADTDTPLQARIGIATGDVVVGYAGALPDAPAEALGDIPNLAARIQSVAAADSVVIDDATRQSLGELFGYADLGAVPLRGVDAPAQLWRLDGARPARGRFEAMRGRGAPLVGRDALLATLRRRWQSAAVGHGRAVLLSGEAGIGKSRLTRELHRWIGDSGADYFWQYYQCSPLHASSALYPVITQIEREAGIVAADPPERRLVKLGRVRAGSDNTRMLPVLAALLSIPSDGRFTPLALSSERQQALTFQALIKQIRAQAERQPLLIVFEDLHWIDPTSQRLLAASVAAARDARVLMLLTTRDPRCPDWLRQPHVIHRPLTRLDRAEVAALIGGLTGVAADAAGLRRVTLQTGGVPLFVEELARAPLDRGEQTPASLQTLLAARLDRAGAAKPLAQVAAVLGREFSVGLLTALADATPGEVRAGLRALCRCDVICRVETGRGYRFRHGLLHDVAYASLLRTRRRELHARAAELLACRDRQPLPEQLARHATAAGDAAAAAEYWLSAAQRALVAAAPIEAASHCQRGLDALADVPDNVVDRDVERKLLDMKDMKVMTVITDSHAEDNGTIAPAAANKHANV